ncbi:MAG: rod shape-determining protein MreC [Bdellovibrionaceae bacterium]|nr:rod shape-determining protein MreC [Pseudobdellovibrionaceae bacterium]
MNFLNIDLKKIIFFLIVIALPLLSINMEQKQTETIWFDEPIQLMASSVQSVFDGFSRGVRETASLYLNLIGIKKDNTDLRHQNSELITRLESMNELRLENDRLRGLLNFKQSTKMELVAAQVVGRDLVPDHSTLTINKGTDHGLKNGQAVITLKGVLGYIFRPTTTTAHVMLLSDRYAVVDGIVQRTRAHGIVEGRGAGGCSLKYIERTEDVKEGDLVVTGGLDNIFPKGFPIAVVESVESKTVSVSLKVELKPIVDPAKVEEVFIVTNAQLVDLESQVAQQQTEPSAAEEK